MQRPDRETSNLVSLALLIVRLTAGALLVGHGSQKLFGCFGGPGLPGTGRIMESLGLRPGRIWAIMAGLSEFGGGLLTLLGLFNPLGPLAVIGAMVMAWTKAHWGKPVWVTSGGAELPLTNITLATALLLAGPGKFSLDTLLGIRLPRWVAIPGLAAVAGVVALGARGNLDLLDLTRQTRTPEQAIADSQRERQTA